MSDKRQDVHCAFFDMDRTILAVDSGMSWIRFLYGRGELTARFLAKATYWHLLYRLAVLDLETLATKLVADLKGDCERDMVQRCQQWITGHLAKEITPAAVQHIRMHQEQGHLVAMITGASQYAAHPIAERVGIEHVLCSRLEVSNERFTGQLASRCFGEHKVHLATQFAEEHGVSLKESVFYTDSYHDIHLLNAVGTGVAVNADARLTREAKRRGWRLESWQAKASICSAP